MDESKPRTITDAVGKVHKIDFAGRRKNKAILESWARGEGTGGQQVLGDLAAHYDVIRGIDRDSFLGKASSINNG